MTDTIDPRWPRQAPASWVPEALRRLACGVILQALRDGDRAFFAPPATERRRFWCEVADLDEAQVAHRGAALLDDRYRQARREIEALFRDPAMAASVLQARFGRTP